MSDSNLKDLIEEAIKEEAEEQIRLHGELRFDGSRLSWSFTDFAFQVSERVSKNLLKSIKEKIEDKKAMWERSFVDTYRKDGLISGKIWGETCKARASECQWFLEFLESKQGKITNE